MASTDDRWERGDPYERYIGRWSRRLAPQFLSWLDAPPQRRWLDVGCGTGALTSAILDSAHPAAVSGVEPSDGFLATAAQRLRARAQLHPGTAAKMPLPDAHADVTVSGLVLNFTPDPAAALAEMLRVTAPGGTVAAYVWDYAEGMQLIRRFWDAALALDERAARSTRPGASRCAPPTRWPRCSPLRVCNACRPRRSRFDTRFEDFDDYWLPFLGGQGPAPAYAMSLDDAARTRLRERLRATLPVQAGGAITLRARAWAVKAQRD